MTEEMVARADSPDGGGKVEAAKEVAGRTAGRAGEVAGEAKSQAKVVARDAADHVRGLVDRARRDVDDEARVRSRQAAGAVRTFADQVGALADGEPDRAGSLAGLVRDGQDRLAMLAGRLDDGPTALLDDVRRFARRQPVLFLASAGAVGFVAGRLLRASREVTSDAAGAQGPTMGDGMPLAAPVPLAVPPEQVPLP